MVRPEEGRTVKGISCWLGEKKKRSFIRRGALLGTVAAWVVCLRVTIGSLGGYLDGLGRCLSIVLCLIADISIFSQFIVPEPFSS